MSSGKKRRTQGERAVVGSIDRSVLCRVLLYLLFVVLSSVLVFTAVNADERLMTPMNAVFINVLMASGLIVLFDMQHLHRVRNGRVSLVFGSILLHLVVIYFVSIFALSIESDKSYALLLLPYAFAPLVNSVLLGRLSGMFTTYVVTMLGGLLAPAGFGMQYMVLSLITGVAVVILTKRVRRRGSLLRAGAAPS